MAPGVQANGVAAGGPDAGPSSTSSTLMPASASSERWIWPATAVFATPSRTHPDQPFAWKREAFDRCIGIHYITRVGMAIGQPQLSIATASAYFHRFYMLQPLQVYPWKDLSATALFLAIKVEEVPRKLDLVVREFLLADGARPHDDNGAPLESKPEFAMLRKRILFYEDILLRTLAYDLAVQHPYVPLIRTVRLLHDWRANHSAHRDGSASSNRTPSQGNHDAGAATPPASSAAGMGREKAKRLSQSAWGFVNDSFSTPLCVIKTPETIAAAAYLLAIKYSQEPIPELYQDGLVKPKDEATGPGATSPKEGEDKGKGVDREAKDQSVPVATDFATKASKAIPNGKPSTLPQTWWGAFGAKSLQDVNEAANIMLDHYERSAADYIRSQARAISRPPDPSPIAVDPYSAAPSRPQTASTAESRPPEPSAKDSDPNPTVTDAAATSQPANPDDTDDPADPPRSMYSPKSRPLKHPRQPEPGSASDPLAPSQKRPRRDPTTDDADASLAQSAAPFPDGKADIELAQQEHQSNLEGWPSPDPPPATSKDPPLPASLTTLAGQGDVGSLPIVLPDAVAAASTSGDPTLGTDPEAIREARAEGEEMKVREEELRLEGSLKREEARLADHETDPASATAKDGANASARDGLAVG